MKIMNKENQVVFSGDWYPAGVMVFWQEHGIHAQEQSPIEFLTSDWEGSDHSARSLQSFCDMFPFLFTAKADDTILCVDCGWYLVPWEMIDNDAPEAWDFWQRMLDTVTPGHMLVNDD